MNIFVMISRFFKRTIFSNARTNTFLFVRKSYLDVVKPNHYHIPKEFLLRTKNIKDSVSLFNTSPMIHVISPIVNRISAYQRFRLNDNIFRRGRIDDPEHAVLQYLNQWLSRMTGPAYEINTKALQDVINHVNWIEKLKKIFSPSWISSKYTMRSTLTEINHYIKQNLIRHLQLESTIKYKKQMRKVIKCMGLMESAMQSVMDNNSKLLIGHYESKALKRKLYLLNQVIDNYAMQKLHKELTNSLSLSSYMRDLDSNEKFKTHINSKKTSHIYEILQFDEACLKYFTLELENLYVINRMMNAFSKSNLITSLKQQLGLYTNICEKFLRLFKLSMLNYKSHIDIILHESDDSHSGTKEKLYAKRKEITALETIIDTIYLTINKFRQKLYDFDSLVPQISHSDDKFSHDVLPYAENILKVLHERLVLSEKTINEHKQKISINNSPVLCFTKEINTKKGYQNMNNTFLKVIERKNIEDAFKHHRKVRFNDFI